MRAPRSLLPAGLALLVLPRALLTYLLMPFPGSQGLDSVKVAYALHQAVPFTTAAGAILALLGTVVYLRGALTRRARIGLGVALALSSALLVFTWYFSARHIFQLPATVAFTRGTTADLPADTLILGVEENGLARAYPVRLLAYHHLVLDELGGAFLLPTY